MDGAAGDGGPPARVPPTRTGVISLIGSVRLPKGSSTLLRDQIKHGNSGDQRTSAASSQSPAAFAVQEPGVRGRCNLGGPQR